MKIASSRKLNVMVVDDDPIMAVLLQALLKQQLGGNANLHVMTNANAALQWLQSNSCDLLFSDIEMPGLDGLELLKVAKSRNAWTQVVFVTGHSSVDRLVEAIEFGATDYLLKPLNHDEFADVVSQLVKRFARWESAVIGTFAVATP